MGIREAYANSRARSWIVNTGIEPSLLRTYCKLTQGTRQKCVNGICGEFYRLAAGSWDDSWESEFFQDILDEVDESDVFYDIGAQYGVYATLVGSLLSSGKALAFEPSPVQYAFTQLHLRRNGVNGEVHRTALLENNAANSEWLDNQQFSFPATTGDKIVRSNARPSVMKIDVEGAELQTLRGFENCLSDHPPRAIYIELHKRANGYEKGLSDEELESLYDKLEQLGYDISELDHREGGSDFIKASYETNSDY